MDDAHQLPFDPLGFKNAPYDHDVLWTNVQRIHPDIESEYFDIRRGRIIQQLGGTFIILVSPEDVKDQGFINRIIKEFRLPQKNVQVKPDSHYSRQMSDAEFEAID